MGSYKSLTKKEISDFGNDLSENELVKDIVRAYKLETNYEKNHAEDFGHETPAEPDDEIYQVIQDEIGRELSWNDIKSIFVQLVNKS